MKQTHANKGVGMLRGSTSQARCVTVWLGATAALAAGGWLAGGTALSVVRPATWQRSFEDLLVAVCAAVLLGCALRLWVVTTVTTVGLARGLVPGPAAGLTRRLVLVACGAAVVAGVSGPALAAHDGDHGRLAGLPLPDRATVGTTGSATPVAHRSPLPDVVVVRDGDSLWFLAAARLPDSAGPDDVDRAWRELYAANRVEIGPDPDLIHPGLRLRLPGTGGGGDR